MKTFFVVITVYLLIMGCSQDSSLSESRQWCEQRNGKYNDGVCNMPVSEADCNAEGGTLEDPWTCVLPMSKEKCDQLGGSLDSNKQCVVN